MMTQRGRRRRGETENQRRRIRAARGFKWTCGIKVMTFEWACPRKAEDDCCQTCACRCMGVVVGWCLEKSARCCSLAIAVLAEGDEMTSSGSKADTADCYSNWFRQ